MLENCRRVCVIGAGTMGGGIAAHLANLGFEVTLLDMTDDSARAGLDRTKHARPPHFYIPQTADSITVLGLEEGMQAIADADWVCEAIIERLDAKQELYAKIEHLIREDALISTNTSGLQISLLKEGRSDSFRRKFLGTHFFNPPRYLKLLELIPTDETDPQVVEDTRRFLEDKVARRVVVAKDTPGFIANRFGMWSMIHAINVTERLGLTIEQADEITGVFLGRPKSGSFRLNDMVGLDIMADIMANLVARRPEDAVIAKAGTPSSMLVLMEKGWIGNKAGQGYYRKEANEFLSFDLRTHAYRQRQEPELRSIAELGKLPLKERLSQGLKLRDEVGEFLREYLVPALQYAHSIREEISFNVQDFDRVMKWGFGWEAGPFEMIDMIGGAELGITSEPFYRDGQILGFDNAYHQPAEEPQFKTVHQYPATTDSEEYSLRDLGDGVTCVATRTKMGVITPTLVDSLIGLIESGQISSLVLTSEAKVFSLGYDLRFFNEKVQQNDFDSIDLAVTRLQKLGVLLSQIPSVAAVFGYCIGGGFELAASCSRIVALAETQIGLPESKVGLLPGGGGTPLMRLRTQYDIHAMVQMVKLLAQGTLSANAPEARKCGFLQETDIIEFHPDRLMDTAKNAALVTGVKPLPEWKVVEGPFVGMVDRMQDELKKNGDFSDQDEKINDRVKFVFGKSTSFEHALDNERDAFVQLAKEGLSQARIKHMVETGKPLRN